MLNVKRRIGLKNRTVSNTSVDKSKKMKGAKVSLSCLVSFRNGSKFVGVKNK